MRPAVHFVWFRGNEYLSAVRVWGKPDFIHMTWDRRAAIEVVDGDMVIFARGDEHQPVGQYNASDMISQDPENGV